MTSVPAVASTLGMAEPLGAALWGITLLHEPCTLTTLSGIVLSFVVSYSFDQTRETKYLFHAIADETVRYQQQKQQSCAMTVFPTIKNR